MTESDTTTSRRQKLRAVDRIIAFGRQAQQKGREAQDNHLSAPDILRTAVDEWRGKALGHFDAASISKEWKIIVNEAAPTLLGIKMVLENLHVLKWRLIDRDDDALDDDERQMMGVRTWLDIWGSILIGRAVLARASRGEYTQDECTAFAAELRAATELATNFAGRQGKLFADIIAKSITIIDDRYDHQNLPYHLRAVDAWHVGWAMTEVAWLLADIVGRAIPSGNKRLCTFPQAQAARLTYRETGDIVCPRCGTDITPGSRARLPSSTFKPIIAECESCEVAVFFPEQALPESIWNGPRLSLVPQNDGPTNGAEDSSVARSQETTAMQKPRIFIGSSVEGLVVAEYIQLGLEHDAEPTIWSQGVFGLSSGTLESLLKAVKLFDFAVLVLTPDDLVHKRDVARNSPRDNVLFELGLFMGALGREKAFIVYCRDDKPDLPTDLAGVTAATFAKRSDGNLRAAIGPVCTEIKSAISAAKAAQQ